MDTDQRIAEIRLAFAKGDISRALQLGLGQGELIESYIWQKLGLQWVDHPCGGFSVTEKPVSQRVYKAVMGRPFKSWDDAELFCSRLGGVRLPSGSDWQLMLNLGVVESIPPVSHLHLYVFGGFTETEEEVKEAFFLIKD